jgi:hypothetical protein
MVTSASEPTLRHLRDLFDVGTVVGLSDGELLARYDACHDGPAFEALVARHGPMVVATCRAILKQGRRTGIATSSFPRRAVYARRANALCQAVRITARRAALPVLPSLSL